MITKVILKNWKSHLNTQLIFSKGTNGLLGHIGSGKTSVFEAICFALFGTTPAIQSKRVKLDGMIMNKPFKKNKAEVEVHFEIDGKNYSVKRIIERKRGTTYSEIREEGKLLESPDSKRVTEIVEKILKVDYDLFTKAIYSEQNELDYFLKIPRGKRKEKIDELLMIDKFERARSGAVSVANRIFDRKEGMLSTIKELKKKDLKKSVEILKKEIESNLKEKNTIKEKLERLKKEVSGLEGELKELKELEEEIKNLEKKKEGLEKSLSEIGEYIKRLMENVKEKKRESEEKNKEQTLKRIEERRKERGELKRELEEINTKLINLKTKASTLEERIKEYVNEINEKKSLREEMEKLRKKYPLAEKRLEELRKRDKDLIKTVERISVMIKDLEESVEKLKESKEKCPVCDSDLPEEKRIELLRKKEDKIKELEKKLQENNEKKSAVENEIEELEEIVDRIKDIEKEVEKIDELEKGKKECEKAINQTKKMIEERNAEKRKTEDALLEVEKELEELNEKLRKIETTLLYFKEIEEREKRLNELKNELEIIERKIDELKLKVKGRSSEELEKKLRTLLEEKKGYEITILRIDEIIEEKKKRLSEYESDLERLKKYEKEVKRLEEIVKEFKIFAKSLERTQIDLRKWFVETVNYTMKEVWSTLYPYEDFIGIRVDVEKGDYILQLQTREGEFVNVDGGVSGGERSIACLALRIALALVLAPQLKWLVLDEPTHNLDKKAIEDFTLTLRGKINEIVEQVFIISHNPEIENAITGYCYRLERNKSIDEPTRVIPLT